MSEHQKQTENSPRLDLKTLFSGRETMVRFSRTFPLPYQVEKVLSAGDVVVNGTVSDYSGVLQFEAEFLFSYTAECDRCLKPISRTLRITLDRPVAKTLDEESEVETVCAQNDVIDLASLCREGVDEHLPFKHLCSEDCKGLCPYCGTDLNEAPCSCKAPPDPRLAGLAEFFHE